MWLSHRDHEVAICGSSYTAGLHPYSGTADNWKVFIWNQQFETILLATFFHVALNRLDPGLFQLMYTELETKNARRL